MRPALRLLQGGASSEGAGAAAASEGAATSVGGTITAGGTIAYSALGVAIAGAIITPFEIANINESADAYVAERNAQDTQIRTAARQRQKSKNAKKPESKPVPAPLPKTKPEEDNKRLFVVRIQAQGGGLERSVPYEGARPMTVAEGLAALSALKTMIGPKEVQKRDRSFQRAERFIRNAAGGGGVGPPGGSFLMEGTKDIRVDVEVKSGINFPY